MPNCQKNKTKFEKRHVFVMPQKQIDIPAKPYQIIMNYSLYLLLIQYVQLPNKKKR